MAAATTQRARRGGILGSSIFKQHRVEQALQARRHPVRVPTVIFLLQSIFLDFPRPTHRKKSKTYVLNDKVKLGQSAFSTQVTFEKNK